MTSLREDHALILEGAPRVELDLARDILEDAGIPCLLVAANSTAAALDIIGIRPVPFGDLYVPNAAREKAIAALDEAWGPEWKASR